MNKCFGWIAFFGLVPFFSNAWASQCHIADLPWEKTVQAYGFDQCDDFNLNHTTCYDSPRQDEAIERGMAALEDELLHCKQVCDYKHGKYDAGTPAEPTCQYVIGPSKIHDYYLCTVSVTVECKP